MKQIKKIFLPVLILVMCIIFNPLNVHAESTLNCRSLLSQGSKGSDVKQLQNELNKTMNCNLVVDGSFGPKTKECVVKFQKKYNLSVDGVVGTSTCNKLNTTFLSDKTYVIVNVSSTGELNVREKATTNSKKIGTTTYGTVYQVYGSTKNGNTTWYKIKYNGKTAYISSAYTKKDGIILDISEQTTKLYKNGKLTLDAVVITGNKGNHDTPTGRYTLKVANKALARTLRGYNDDGTKYASYVDYWMPFITSRGIGFHDASWRSSSEFRNINTYTFNGSHACVNMKKEDAKTLYNSITSDINVYVVA